MLQLHIDLTLLQLHIVVCSTIITNTTNTHVNVRPLDKKTEVGLTFFLNSSNWKDNVEPPQAASTHDCRRSTTRQHGKCRGSAAPSSLPPSH